MKQETPYSKLVWACAWRNLRKSMKDPAELAWRLRADFRHGEPTSYTWYHNHACTAMYARSLPDPPNVIERQKVVFHKGIYRYQKHVPASIHQ